MQQEQIFGPFFAMMTVTLAVWIYLFVVRIPFINGLGPVDFSVPGELARLSPPKVSNPSDNFKNLFELPVLFYALVLCLFVTNQVDSLHVACAWIFVVFRALHSIVHCTFNHVMTRFGCYAVSATALWVMMLRAAIH